MLYWHPTDHFAADPTIVEHDGRFHLFFESTTAAPVPGEPRGPLTICHFVSDDLERWTPLPHALRVGPAGAWDGYLLYHLDVVIVDGTWWMFYTGLDKPGAGQRQRVGVATSRDGIAWSRNPANPVLVNEHYERAIPAEASHRHGDKDLGREWFRDPFVTFDPKLGRWVLLIVARDPARPADARACVAGYTSSDLLHWRSEGPVFSPGRFHTVETPSLVEHAGRHYLVYMSSTSWGVPIVSSDPHQNSGNYVAVSDSGPLGPFRELPDELLIASTAGVRLGAQRILKTSDGRCFLYGWLATRLGPTDGPSDGTRATVFPTLKPVTFEHGHVRVGMPDCLRRLRRSSIDPDILSASGPVHPILTAGGVEIKNYKVATAATTTLGDKNILLEATIRFHQGERAGLIFRSDGSTGLAAILDRRRRCVELRAIGRPASAADTTQPAEQLTDATTFDKSADPFVDARAWKPTDVATLTVACDGVAIEVYVDGRLMLQHARHRERGAGVGVFVEQAHATFTDLAHAPIST